MEGYQGEGPKWRLEHASSGQAVCQQAACKQEKVKILKGELRVGTHRLFDKDGEHRWYMAWRHWGCATKYQIKGLKEVTENDPTKAPGYNRLSLEAQEQVRLAFENESIVDKEFKGISAEGAKVAPRYDGEILNATGYKADIAKRGTAGCRNSDCPGEGVKIAKGELRLGICVPFEGEHASWVYKHWKCMSKFDLEAAQECYKDGAFHDIHDLPEDYKTVVLDTLEKGEVIEPSKPESAPAPKPKKSKKRVYDDDDSEAELPKRKRKSKGKGKMKAEDTEDEAETTKPKPKRKAKSKKRPYEELDNASEPEYVPKKTRSRAAPMEEVADPAVARIQVMTESLGDETAR